MFSRGSCSLSNFSPSNHAVRFYDLGLVWGILRTPLCLDIWCCMWTNGSDIQGSLSSGGYVR